MISGQYKTVCLYQYGGCAVNCSTVIDFNDSEIEIRDRYGNVLKLSKDKWLEIEKEIIDTDEVNETIRTKLRLSNDEKDQLLDFIKEEAFQ